jgi:hypothetical protein
LVACGSDSGRSEPVVDQIDDAIAAVEVAVGGPQEFFEIAADVARVRLFVATPTGADAFLFEDGQLIGEAVAVEGAAGAAFEASTIAFDPERIFEGLRAELNDPVIVDFAIQGGPNGAVVYDATVASDSGGVLLVLLGPTGQVLGVQAA